MNIEPIYEIIGDMVIDLIVQLSNYQYFQKHKTRKQS